MNCSPSMFVITYALKITKIKAIILRAKSQKVPFKQTRTTLLIRLHGVRVIEQSLNCCTSKHSLVQNYLC